MTAVTDTLYVPLLRTLGKGPAENNPVESIVWKNETFEGLFVLVVEIVQEVATKLHVEAGRTESR